MKMKHVLCGCTLVASVLFSAHHAIAQEIVHALCGTVSSINTANKTITLFLDSGSRGTFQVMAASGTRVAFDKKIAEETTSAKQFQKQGAYVILFYFGTEDNRTAVALKNLGAGPFSSTTGQITGLSGRDHSVSVRGKDGATHSYQIDAQTVAETSLGAVNGAKANLEKGEQVRLVTALKGGTPTALFIREM